MWRALDELQFSKPKPEVDFHIGIGSLDKMSQMLTEPDVTRRWSPQEAVFNQLFPWGNTQPMSSKSWGYLFSEEGLGTSLQGLHRAYVKKLELKLRVGKVNFRRVCYCFKKKRSKNWYFKWLKIREPTPSYHWLILLRLVERWHYFENMSGESSSVQVNHFSACH